MILLILGLLVMPVCATVAGLVVWMISTGEDVEDGKLVRNFVFVLLAALALVWQAARSNVVRMKLDPEFRFTTELNANPVYTTVNRVDPDGGRVLAQFIAARYVTGSSVADAVAEARPLLTDLMVHRSGWADQKTRLEWGRHTVRTLKELQRKDPLLCYQALAEKDRESLTHALSADNNREFQEMLIAIHESADHGIRREYPPEDKPADFNETALEFRAIQDDIGSQFGKDVEQQVAHHEFPYPPIAEPAKMCAARIYQLEAMLRRPQAKASMLIDSALRYR